MMKIFHWDVSDAEVLTQVYNKQTADVPHCYPVSPVEFGSGLRSLKSDRHFRELDWEKIIVGKRSGRIIGFAHISKGKIEFSDRKRIGGLIHFLTYQAGYRSAGQAILEECERDLHNSGIRQIWAFQNVCSYPFYHLEFGNLSDRMGHVYGLFRINGYEVNEGERFMEEREFGVTEPILPDAQVQIIIKQEPPKRAVLPGLVVQSYRGDKQIGICEAGSAGECCQSGEAQDCFFIHWLGVEEPEQGKGWGRYLLQRMRWEMHKIGYRNAVISTDMANYRALTFYTNYGYQVTDTVYGFAKSMS